MIVMIEDKIIYFFPSKLNNIQYVNNSGMVTFGSVTFLIGPVV